MTKRESLLAMVQKDWVAIDVLCAQLEWQPHTVRGALSTLGKTHAIERKREGGRTFYRIAPPSESTSTDPQVQASA